MRRVPSQKWRTSLRNLLGQAPQYRITNSPEKKEYTAEILINGTRYASASHSDVLQVVEMAAHDFYQHLNHAIHTHSERTHEHKRQKPSWKGDLVKALKNQAPVYVVTSIHFPTNENPRFYFEVKVMTRKHHKELGCAQHAIRSWAEYLAAKNALDRLEQRRSRSSQQQEDKHVQIYIAATVHSSMGEIGHERGKETENRVFHSLLNASHRPKWFISIKKTPPHHPGFDFIIETTDVGNIFLEVKSSKLGVDVYWDTHPASANLVVIDVDYTRSDEEIALRCFSKIGQARIKLLQRQHRSSQ